jgi:hypothetical protein
MSVYVIAQGKLETRGLLDQYVAKASPAIKSHEGRTVAFHEEPEGQSALLPNNTSVLGDKHELGQHLTPR